MHAGAMGAKTRGDRRKIVPHVFAGGDAFSRELTNECMSGMMEVGALARCPYVKSDESMLNIRKSSCFFLVGDEHAKE